jgi:hypothetical protein
VRKTVVYIRRFTGDMAHLCCKTTKTKYKFSRGMTQCDLINNVDLIDAIIKACACDVMPQMDGSFFKHAVTSHYVCAGTRCRSVKY